MSELVLCFPKDVLGARVGTSNAFYDESLWDNVLSNLKPFPREEAETNYDYKQLIVYVLFKSRDLILSYKRTPKTDEARLKNLYSIGIGGHVNIHDLTQVNLFDVNEVKDVLIDSVSREIREEVKINTRIKKSPELIGFINDDSNDVGKVHFGTVWTLELDEPSVAPTQEKGIGSINFLDIKTLDSRKDEFESWSQLLIDFIK